MITSHLLWCLSTPELLNYYPFFIKDCLLETQLSDRQNENRPAAVNSLKKRPANQLFTFPTMGPQASKLLNTTAFNYTFFVNKNLGSGHSTKSFLN